VHVVGTIDIGCYHIDYVEKDIREPREVIRHPDLAGLLERLAPHINRQDKLMTSQATARSAPGADVIDQLMGQFTAVEASMCVTLGAHPAQEIPALAQMVAHELQMPGHAYPAGQ